MPDNVSCHACLVRAAPKHEFAVDSIDETIDLSLRSHFLAARTASRPWREEGKSGHLFFTSSWVQDVPGPESTRYAASKSVLRTMLRRFAREMAPFGIRANSPGIFGVGMARRQWDTAPRYRARAAKAIPLGELQAAGCVLLTPLRFSARNCPLT